MHVINFSTAVLALAGSGITAAMPAITEAAVPASTTECTVTAEPSPTIPANCNLKFCQDGTSYCHYRAGITGWDSSNNPIPGMVRTSIGTCASAVAE